MKFNEYLEAEKKKYSDPCVAPEEDEEYDLSDPDGVILPPPAPPVSKRVRAPLSDCNMPHPTEDKVDGIGKYLIRAIDLYRSPEELAAEERPYVIERLLGRQGVAECVAPPKLGKSTIAAVMTLWVANDRKFLGRKTLSGGRRVLYINLEMHRDDIQRMFVPFTQRPDDLENIDFLNMRSAPPDMKQADTIAEYLKTQYKAGIRYALVVADCLYLLTDAEENDNGAQGALRHEFCMLADELDSAFFLIHHTGKGSRDQKETTFKGRGASAAAAAVDTYMCLETTHERGVLRLQYETRGWPGQDQPSYFRFEEIGGGRRRCKLVSAPSDNKPKFTDRQLIDLVASLERPVDLQSILDALSKVHGKTISEPTLRARLDKIQRIQKAGGGRGRGKQILYSVLPPNGN